MLKTTLLAGVIALMSVPAFAGNRIVHCDAVFVDGSLTGDSVVTYQDDNHNAISVSTAATYEMAEDDELVKTVKNGAANCQITTSASDG